MKTKHLFFAMVVAALPFLFLTQSCETVKEEIQEAAAFDVAMGLPDHYFPLDSVEISESGAKNEIILTEQSVEFGLDSVLSSYGINSATLSNATFTSVTLTMDNPVQGASFDFMSGMRVVLSETSDFASETQIASADEIAAGSTMITFTLENENIESFLENEDIYLRLYGNLNGPLPFATLPLILQSGVAFTVNPI
ncbi:MAG: hypothetical protein DRJ05_02785 [Bacteroidetes bacterium]|nr:MAG: hypothetical protein DRJ05_02785 [Bacteroidota bacterium]